MVLSFWAFEKVKFYNAWHLVEMTVHVKARPAEACNNTNLHRMTAAVGSSSMPSAVTLQPLNMFSANGST